MFRKLFPLPKKGMEIDRILRKVGIEKQDHEFWIQLGKSVIYAYAMLGAYYVYKKIPKPRRVEEMEIGTTEGLVETDKDSVNPQKVLEDEKFEQDAQKIWNRLRNEALMELQQKGYDKD